VEETGDRRLLGVAHDRLRFAPLSSHPSVVIEGQLNFLRRSIMYVQPLDGALGANPLSLLAGTQSGAGAPPAGQLPGTLASDAISRMVPPGISSGMSQNPLMTGLFGPLYGMLEQLMQMLQQMLGGAGTCYPPYGYEQYFQNATGGSSGDPHLSFNAEHWNSMLSQPDLLNSDSIPGGFQISTQTTPPNAAGVTWNQSASIALDGGSTTISMNDTSQAGVTRNGVPVTLLDGQTMQLGAGASVTRNQSGSLTVVAQGSNGGQITTTLTAQGQGVNVGVSAQNVDLGGALVDGPQGGSPIPIDPHLPQPIPSPVFNPIENPFPNPIQSPYGFTDPFAQPQNQPL
jgi:hypothetical protein